MKPKPGQKIHQSIILSSKESAAIDYGDKFEKVYIILCIWPKRGEFVTWYLDPNGDTTSGRYFTDLEAAQEDFKNRF